ncbi:hypothetical protein I5S84_24520 [Pseudomonas putida]|jgi:hypothetical protein|uniref:Uncharacterized protein n=2 Tax=Pseudomonas TaxID=286 RepID=A0ABD7B6M7_PSEPU|nr:MULTISPECIES: hypothetical protein [Pseudomonas]PTB98947.1 hypothetical protein C9975_10075 [Thalassospira xiamenensis]MBH3451991.1 hypothetical protein [Pseudomonas putida]MDO1494355.1 hypothetical protein [Pseudomonas putida]QOC96165.1 hypothetical protein ID616_18925 [Pseudomonas putida]WAP61956.1 hypothetical protein OZ911_18785 [Pseudomonas putida]
MRNRGKVYWEWANPEMYFRNYDERLTCGTLINIQARLSPENATQLFLGIYGEKGVLLLEELHPNCCGQKPSVAIAWAIERAHGWVAQAFPAPKAPGPEPLPRRGSRLHR